MILMQEVKKNSSELKYENLINYRICEIMYLHMKLTEYNTFSHMCSNIRDTIKTNNGIGGQLGKLVKLILRDLKKLYGLEHDESVRMIINFLENKLWEHYQKPVMIFITKTPNSFQ